MAIQQFPTPTDITAVCSFVGLAGYYRKFIAKFSELAEPLTRLTRREVPFQWGPDQDRAFNKIKELLSQDPMLIHFDHTLPTELHCDAYGGDIGAVLIHRKADGPHAVWYIS